jgi:hypothetical protein
MAMVDGCSWLGMGWDYGEDCEVGEPIDRRDAPLTMDVTGLQPWMSGQKRLEVVLAGRGRSP